MKLLVIQFCNFEDYPTGGHLTFVRNMISSFSNDSLSLVGISTDKQTPIGRWTTKTINGKEYNYFSVKRCKVLSSKPIIPMRFIAFMSIYKYRKAFLKCDYDYIFFQTNDVLFSLSPKELQKSCICLPGVKNSLTASRYKWARKLDRLYDYLFFKKVHHLKLILASASNNEILELIERSKGRLSPDRIKQYPTRYDEKIFFPKSKEQCRKELNIPESMQSIITVGRLAEFKGWRLMIDAFEIFKKRNSNGHLFFIGDGEDENIIKGYITEKGLEDKITLLGRKSPQIVSSYLSASDIFIMGSLYEGWSTALVEACACGIPCVTTDFSSADEMIKVGQNGYILRNRDEKELSDLIEKALHLDRNEIIKNTYIYDSLAIKNMPTSIESAFNTSSI